MDLKDHLVLMFGFVFVWDCLHLCSNFFLYQELASFPLLAFFRKGKKKNQSDPDTHSFPISENSVSLLALRAITLHLFRASHKWNKSGSCVENEKYFWLLFSQISTNWFLRFFHYIYICTCILKYVGATIILCKMEPIFSQVVVSDYLSKVFNLNFPD